MGLLDKVIGSRNKATLLFRRRPREISLTRLVLPTLGMDQVLEAPWDFAVFSA